MSSAFDALSAFVAGFGLPKVEGDPVQHEVRMNKWLKEQGIKSEDVVAGVGGLSVDKVSHYILDMYRVYADDAGMNRHRCRHQLRSIDLEPPLPLPSSPSRPLYSPSLPPPPPSSNRSAHPTSAVSPSTPLLRTSTCPIVLVPTRLPSHSTLS